jgi:type VI secretion system protein ImpH
MGDPAMSSAAYSWEHGHSLVSLLGEQPWQFEFYQAVRLLEALQRQVGASFSREENSQTIRFQSRVNFNFPASEVQDISLDSDVTRVAVNFLGLAGATGPLPAPYAEMVLEALARKDHGAVDFLDIFNNRLVWLLYRARQAHHPVMTARAPHEGQVAKYLFSLIGLGQNSLRDRLKIPDRSLLHYSGLLANRVRSAAGLERLLSDYFDVQVNVNQFRGVWRELETAQQTRLGDGGSNQCLGGGIVLGRRVWDQSGGLSITFGPLDRERFTAFLPKRSASRALCELARFYVGLDYEIQIRLLLKPADVPQSALGKARLGYTSWLLRHAYAGESAEVRFAAWFETGEFETAEPAKFKAEGLGPESQAS